MSLIFGIIILLTICFGGVLLFGAPYLPSLSKQTRAAIQLAGPAKGGTLLELGCGDGKVVIAAADAGWRVVGYELNPILAVVTWLRTRKYRGRVRIVWGNFWTAEWPECQVIFTFLLPKYMERLSNKVIQECDDSVKLISFAFTVPDIAPSEELDGVFAYDGLRLRSR
jgi:SAM-dependent methyltransferase